MNEELPEENFSDDAEEQLRLENDILKLKIQAELGGQYEEGEELPPEIENIFLKNVLEFEHKHANAPVKKLYEVLGCPEFKKVCELNDDEVAQALTAIEKIMEEKGIEVDYCAEYSPRVKYAFITEELFEEEAVMMGLPGMTMHYIYEEFHPNHDYDIRRVAETFFNNWMKQLSGEYEFELAPELILENGTVLKREDVLKKLHLLFAAFDSFKEGSFSIDNISWQLDGESGLGNAEGFVKYDAVMENGEVLHFDGPFKFYIQYGFTWRIFFFHWPGFVWE